MIKKDIVHLRCSRTDKKRMVYTCYYSYLLILGLCFSVIFPEDNEREEYLIFHAVPAKWQDAREICATMYNGTLLELNRQSLEDKLIALRHHIRLLHHTKHLQIWVDRHSILTSWYSYEGCFYETFLSDEIKVTIRKTDHPFYSCSSSCSHEGYTYFGIKVNKCLCYKDLSIKTKTRQSACSSQCPDNHELRCGGSNYMSIYKFFSTADDDILQYRRCSTVSCDDDGKTIIKAQYCNASFNALCENKETTQLKTIFKQSLIECESDGGLHGLENGSACPLSPSSKKRQQYWINLARYEIHSQSGQNPYRCSLAHFDGRQMTLKATSCRRSFQFACKTDKSNKATMCKSVASANRDGDNVDIMYKESESLQAICAEYDGRSADFYHTGFIAIIVSCGVIVLWCCITMICCCKKKKKKLEDEKQNKSALQHVKYQGVKKTDYIEPIEETLE